MISRPHSVEPSLRSVASYAHSARPAAVSAIPIAAGSFAPTLSIITPPIREVAKKG